MPAIKCPNCGRNYSNTLQKCPYCHSETAADMVMTKKENISKQQNKQLAPIHTRPTSKTSEKKEDSSSKTANNTHSDDNELIEKLAKLQAQLNAIESENEKLKQSLKEQDANKKTETIKEADTTPAPSDHSDVEVNDNATDENFDRIMNPEKYEHNNSSNGNSIIDKVSGILPTLKEVAKKESSKYLSSPVNTDKDTNEELEATLLPMQTQVTSVISDENIDNEDDYFIHHDNDAKEYDPNYDHYYDDELPELIAEKDRIPKSALIRTGILIAACLTAFIVAAFRLVNNV